MYMRMKVYMTVVCRMAAVAAAIMLMASCCNSVRVSGTVAGAGDSELVLKSLPVGTDVTVDTLKTDADGRFSFKYHVRKDEPQFVYLYYKDRKIVSLLLENGDKVEVDADTLGTRSLSGSDESLKLISVEKDFSDFLTKFNGLYMRYLELKPESDEAKSVNREMSKEYINYYRSRVRYVMENYNSLSIIPVLYQSVNENLPVFAQSTDAIHFRNACDSLMSRYPDSEYVTALKAETDRRYKVLELSARIEGAERLSFPDLNLPDINARKIKLSEVDAKLVMLYFWTVTNDLQKMNNLDILKPLYEKYHDRGFEIYQVAIDVDKTMWAGVLKNQKLPWLNVCDGLGADSPAAQLYNVTGLPRAYFIYNGELLQENGFDKASLSRLLERYL